MTGIPARPKIYHITHLRNLPQIVTAGRIWSDAKRIELGLESEIVGMAKIKRRRLEELEVHCHRGTKVGQYVPFYFCPRSIMLYILHRGNHPDLNYREGQQPIVHLQADLLDTVRLANQHGVRWAFSNTNAGARYDGKQAEFLVFESFPWPLVERIGVASQAVLQQVQEVLADVAHQPPASVEPGWYF